jgi:hypothetical protein
LEKISFMEKKERRKRRITEYPEERSASWAVQAKWAGYPSNAISGWTLRRGSFEASMKKLSRSARRFRVRQIDARLTSGPYPYPLLANAGFHESLSSFSLADRSRSFPDPAITRR